MHRIAPLTLATLLAQTAWANPGPVGGPGSGPWPLRKSSAVAMERATIVITDGVKSTSPPLTRPGKPQPLHTVVYRGRYTLKNTSNTPVKLKVGFPNAIEDERYGGNVPFGHIRNFEARVDGKRIRTKVVTRRIKGTIFWLRDIPKPVLNKLVAAGLAEVIAGHDQIVNLAKLGLERRVIARRLRKVALTKAQRSALIAKMLAFYKRPKPSDIKVIAQDWYTFELRIPAKRSTQLLLGYDSPRGHPGIVAASGYRFGYTMRTGASWAKPIGRYTVELALKTTIPLSRYRIQPKGFRKVKGRRRVLRRSWRNFVPTEDLVVEVAGKP